MRRAPSSSPSSPPSSSPDAAGPAPRTRTARRTSAAEQKAVATTIEDLQTAAKDKDGTKVCSDLITAELRDQISTSNCGKVVKDAIRDTDEVGPRGHEGHHHGRQGGRRGEREGVRQQGPQAHDRAWRRPPASGGSPSCRSPESQPPWNSHAGERDGVYAGVPPNDAWADHVPGVIAATESLNAPVAVVVTACVMVAPAGGV